MNTSLRLGRVAAATLFLTIGAASLHAQSCLGAHPVLDTWTNGSYTVAGETPSWYILPANGTGGSEIACISGQSAIPAILHGECTIGCRRLSFTMKGRGDDDDAIGFVLGFRPGDQHNQDADYLAVMWTRNEQNAQLPGCGPVARKPKGLHLTRVFGKPDPAEFWCQGNADLPCSDMDSGVEILQQAEHLGETGWPRNTPRDVIVEATPDRLRVYIEGRLEIDYSADLSRYMEGLFGFYAQSQFADFWGFHIEALAETTALWENYGTGLAGCDGVPALTMLNRPVIGSSPMISIGNTGSVERLAAMVWGLAPGSFFLPLLGGELLVSPPFAAAVAMPIPAGGYVFACTIPDRGCSSGDELYLQIVQIDPCGPAGFAMSAGMRLLIGDV